MASSAPGCRAVHAGIDDDGAADSDFLCKDRNPRADAPAAYRGARRVGIFLAGPKNVGMRVGRQRRQLDFGVAYSDPGRDGWRVHESSAGFFTAYHEA